jgi:glutathione S-transferase
MHAGFSNLREHMPMNVRGSFPGRGRTPAVEADIERVLAIWSECRRSYGADGAFLFGRFSAADAMYAPVALRFVTYAVPLPAPARAYVDSLLALPALREWCAAAAAEHEVIAEDEPYR